jgi:hypothetical protein
MRFIIGIFLVVIIGMSTDSCQKEFTLPGVDSTLITPPAVTGNFTAEIDGAKFIANKTAAASRSLNVIAITGQATDGESIVLRVADSGVHVYSLGVNSVTNVGGYTKDSSTAYLTIQGNNGSESGGTLSITSIDTVQKTMSGTFSMDVYRGYDLDHKAITEGVFTNISYATQALPPASANDSFMVKINGTQFPVYSITGLSTLGTISLVANDQSLTHTVSISMPATITAGSYTFTPFVLNYLGQYNIDSSYLISSSGTLTILEHNTTTKRIRGNFSFTAAELPGTGTQTATLTDGYFSIRYQ